MRVRNIQTVAPGNRSTVCISARLGLFLPSAQDERACIRGVEVPKNQS